MSSFLDGTGLSHLIQKIKNNYISTADTSNFASVSEAISALSLTMDSEYKLTLSGRTADGSGFTVSDVIDLPLETMVVSGAYDSANTQIVLTLKNGSTTSFPVSALVDGLQSEITSQNTLSADLISDGTTNKVVTGTDKTNWNNAASSAHSHDNKTALDTITTGKTANWDNAYASAHTHSNKSVLDNLTQGVIDSAHTHTNKTVLDSITASDIENINSAIHAIVLNDNLFIPDTADTSNTVYISAATFDDIIVVDDGNTTQLDNTRTNGLYRVNYLGNIKSSSFLYSAILYVKMGYQDGVDQIMIRGTEISTRTYYRGSWGEWTYYDISYLLSSTNIENWDNAYASAHTHSNKSVLDNLTQTVIDNSHTHSNKTALDAITTGKTQNWDNAYASAHTHTNKSTLDGISSTDVTNWNNAASSAHSHSNSTVLDNLTQTVIDNSHTHSNKTALDTITATKTQNWDNAYASAHTHSNASALNNLTQTVIDNSHTHSNKSALDAITATKTQNWDNAYASAHTHSNKAVLDNLTQGVIDSAHTHTNKTVLDNLTQTVIDNSHTHSNSAALNAITTGKTQNWDNAYASAHTHSNKSTLDSITSADVTKWNGVTGKTDSTTFGTHSATTISNGTSSQMHLPTVSASDNNKVLMVVDGVWTLVTPSMIYSGSGVPDNSQGNDGDLYIQTS